MEYKPDVNIEKNSCEAGSESIDRSQGNELSCVSCGNEDKKDSATCVAGSVAESGESTVRTGQGQGKKDCEDSSKQDVKSERSLLPWHVKAINLLTSFDNDYSIQDVAKQVGVTRRTLSKVLNHNLEFQKEYERVMQLAMVKQKSKVDSALTKKAQNGDTSAIRLYYERIENMQNRLRTDLAIEVDVL